jgi:hypothetical protein
MMDKRVKICYAEDVAFSHAWPRTTLDGKVSVNRGIVYFLINNHLLQSKFS